jgi:hypothetical protein
MMTHDNGVQVGVLPRSPGARDRGHPAHAAIPRKTNAGPSTPLKYAPLRMTARGEFKTMTTE